MGDAAHPGRVRLTNPPAKHSGGGLPHGVKTPVR